MSLKRGGHAAIAAASAIVIALACSAVGAMAAGSTLTLEVKGQYARAHRVACHKNKLNWRAFHRGSTLEFRGFLRPAPARHFAVRVKIERCVRGNWTAVHNFAFTGENATDPHPGRFKAFVAVRPYAPAARRHRATASYYRARAYAGTATSSEQYFFVTSN